MTSTNSQQPSSGGPIAFRVLLSGSSRRLRERVADKVFRRDTEPLGLADVSLIARAISGSVGKRARNDTAYALRGQVTKASASGQKRKCTIAAWRPASPFLARQQRVRIGHPWTTAPMSRVDAEGGILQGRTAHRACRTRAVQRSIRFRDPVLSRGYGVDASVIRGRVRRR